jgi:hypothetical protein
MRRFVFIQLISCFSFSAVFISVRSSAQNISGIWQGKLTQEPGGCFPEYFIELQIQADHGDIAGISYDYYDTTKFVKLSFWGTTSGGGKKTIKLAEKTILKQQIPEDCIPCMKTYDLTYSRQNNVESLSGKWVGEDMGTIAGCPPGDIFLKRVAKSAFEEKKSRTTELAHIFYVDSPTVNLAFYDNGVVDGDSITVYFDDQTIVAKKGLSLEPIRVQLQLDPSKEHKVVMYAESLGTIPPNTALVVLTSGSARYEVLLSSSTEKNSAIIIICGKQPASDSEHRN